MSDGLCRCSHGPGGLWQVGRGTPCAPVSKPERRAEDCPPYQFDRPQAGGYKVQKDTYAAFFSPDNAPRIFFIHADKRWRFCSRRTTASLVTQLN